MLQDAASFLQLPDPSCIERAVVTVPAYFQEPARKATQRAAQLAGLKTIKLLTEPEAAALAYGLGKRDSEDELILVFDLGGGTFDVSVLEVGGGTIEVVATSGDAELGGDDFDDAFAQLLNRRAMELGSADLTSTPQSLRLLLRRTEELKVQLSNEKSAKVKLPDLAPFQVTRAELEKAVEPVLLRLLRPLREAALLAQVALLGDSALDVDLMEEADDSAADQSLKQQQRSGKVRAKMR